ncbi:MAG: hydrogenase maturation protease [Isosphaeraceae bacterium]
MARNSRKGFGTCSVGDYLTASAAEFHPQGGSKLLRVIGIGSPHGDDQVGWKLVEELARSGRTDVSAHSVTTPIDLLDHLNGCDALIVIDACDAGLEPGTVVVREWPTALEECGKASTHGFGVASALRLAESLGCLPGKVVLLGVQKCQCEPSGDLSDEVNAVWPRITAQLVALIDGLTCGPAELL